MAGGTSPVTTYMRCERGLDLRPKTHPVGGNSRSETMAASGTSSSTSTRMPFGAVPETPVRSPMLPSLGGSERGRAKSFQPFSWVSLERGSRRIGSKPWAKYDMRKVHGSVFHGALHHRTIRRCASFLHVELRIFPRNHEFCTRNRAFGQAPPVM